MFASAGFYVILYLIQKRVMRNHQFDLPLGAYKGGYICIAATAEQSSEKAHRFVRTADSR